MQYLLQQYPEHTPLWLERFEGEVHRLEDMWKLTTTGHETASRFGTILYGRSEIYGDVAMKIVPWFSPRLQGETYCYRYLPYREMCPLYDVDEELGAMLLKYVPPTGIDRAACKENTIAALYDQRRACTAQDGVLPLYGTVLQSVAENALNEISRTGETGYRHMAAPIRRAQRAIHAFDGETLCTIHGDAHGFNLLEEGDHCLLIDPLGYRAPFPFEWARYLGTAMKETAIPDDDFRALALRLSGGHRELADVLRAFAVDTTLRACNTFIEGNTYEEICFAADWAQRAWQYHDTLTK